MLFNKLKPKRKFQWVDKSLLRTLIFLLVVITAHVISMVMFENMGVLNAVWLTLTTASTTGYGDYAAQSIPGRLSTVILLYVAGIFLTAKVVDAVISNRMDIANKQNTGRWRGWKLKDHIIIINTPGVGGDVYFKRLICQLRGDEEFKGTQVHLLTRAYPDGLPEEIKELGLVSHFNGTPDTYDSLKAIHIDSAKAIIIMAKDEYDGMSSDALTFDTLHRFKKKFNVKATIVAECVNEHNRERFIEAGAAIVIRPIRSYPEIVVRALAAPGSETVLENLFLHEGVYSRRYNVDLKDLTWGDIAHVIMVLGIGTAMAYLDLNGKVVCNERPDKKITCTALLVMVSDGELPDDSVITKMETILMNPLFSLDRRFFTREE